MAFCVYLTKDALLISSNAAPPAPCIYIVIYNNWYITRALIGRGPCVIRVQTQMTLQNHSILKILYRTNRFHIAVRLHS